MKHNPTFNPLVLSALAIVLSATAHAAQPVGKYRLIDLNSTSMSSSKATGLNSVGEVVGTAVDTSGVSRGFHAFGNARHFLPIPTWMSTAIPAAINDSGQIAGRATVYWNGAYYTRGVYWADETTYTLNVTPFNETAAASSAFSDLDNSGYVVGSASGTLFNGVPTAASQGMYFYVPSYTRIYLGTNAGTASATASMSALNNLGIMAGYSQGTDGKIHAVKYSHSLGMVALGDPAGTVSSNANDVNDSSQFVGEYYPSNIQSKAFMKPGSGAMIDIPRLAGATGDDSNTATAINAAGYVVGACEIGNTNRNGYLWDGTKSWNLNSITKNISGYTIQSAEDINSRAQIAATAKVASGETHAVLLKPLQTIQGTLFFEDWSTYPSAVSVDWEMVSTIGIIVDSGTVKPTILGTFTIETTAGGAGTLHLKPSHWLAKNVAYDLESFEALTVNLSFKNGDIDGDNTVSILDYSVLSESFDTVVGQPAFDVRADLDGDGAVTILDYSVLSTNFDLEGDF